MCVFTLIVATGYADLLLSQFHVIFDEADPDGDGDQEDELDSPILEEDEDEDDVNDSDAQMTLSNHLDSPAHTYASS